MRKLVSALMCLALLLSMGCSTVRITRHPTTDPYDLQRGTVTGTNWPAPTQDGDAKYVDIRGFDLRNADLRAAFETLVASAFDSATKWPSQLPEGFGPDALMEMGKNPGLNIRALHQRGITGEGIGVAIIDFPLLVDHVEYVDRLRLYEDRDSQEIPAQMHGTGAASIAVGKTVGVAPGADLYFIGDPMALDFTHLAASIDRVIEINRSLKKGHKIRVLAIEIGWGPSRKGAAEMDEAVARASAEGIFVVTSSLQDYAHMGFQGLGRDPMADPDDIGSYGPGGFYAEWYEKGERTGYESGSYLFVPMDSRCIASQTGPGDYVYWRYGGWSWCVPWLAGLYALACDVKPDVTPQEFWQTALITGDSTTVHGQDGIDRYLGVIVNPVKLIDALSAKR